MSASTTDSFKKVAVAGAATTVTVQKNLGDTSITVASTNSWPTDTGIVIAMRQVDGTGTEIANTYTEYNAKVTSTTTIQIVATPIYGSDQVYPAASTSQVFVPVSALAYNQAMTGLLVQHNQDGTHGAVTATSLNVTTQGNLQDGGFALQTMRSETSFDFVASGCVWTADAAGSTRNASMTSGVVYIGGQRLTVSAVTARSFTASKDTYIDVLNTAGVASIVYTEVTNNTASASLAANSLRIGIIVTGASSIAAASSINQGQESMVLPIVSSVPYAVTDSIGNLICPRDPNRRILGLRQSTSSVTSTSASGAQLTGLSVPFILPYLGRKVSVEVKAPGMFTSANSNNYGWNLWDGTVGSGTQLTANSNRNDGMTTGANFIANASGGTTTTPTATSKTYNLGGFINTGTFTLSGTTTGPIQLIVRME